MQKQDSILKVRGTLNSNKPSQFCFSQVGFNVGRKFGLFPHQKLWVQGRLHFLRDSFGGVASTSRKFVGISP